MDGLEQEGSRLKKRRRRSTDGKKRIRLKPGQEPPEKPGWQKPVKKRGPKKGGIRRDRPLTNQEMEMGSLHYRGMNIREISEKFGLPYWKAYATMNRRYMKNYLTKLGDKMLEATLGVDQMEYLKRTKEGYVKAAPRAMERDTGEFLESKDPKVASQSIERIQKIAGILKPEQSERPSVSITISDEKIAIFQKFSDQWNRAHGQIESGTNPELEERPPDQSL